MTYMKRQRERDEAIAKLKEQVDLDKCKKRTAHLFDAMCCGHLSGAKMPAVLQVAQSAATLSMCFSKLRYTRLSCSSF